MKLTDQHATDLQSGRRPSSPVARATFDALDWLDGKKVHGVEGLELRTLRRRAHAALVRYEAGRPVADGRPSGAGGGSGELTSVEAAAQRRIGVDESGRRLPSPLDPVHEHAHRAAVAIAEAARLLQTADAAFDAIDRITADAPLDSPSCDACNQAGVRNPPGWDHYGDVNGKLPRPMHLCKPHIDYVSTYGHLPTAEQTKQHDASGRWRVRAS